MSKRRSLATRRLVLAALAAVLMQGLAAEVLQVFAIRGARVVPVAGPVVESGTVITQGDLFDDKVVFNHVFVAGRQVTLQPPSPGAGGRPGR